ncbi:MAG TPA: hypothetical protein VF158_09080 [Longimicrobiales bacterium]
MATQTPVLGLTKPELTDEIPATILALAENADKIEGAIASGGTFTPTLGATTAHPTVTYAAQEGAWARVGPLVFVFVRIDWTAISGGSGDVRILGLDALPAPGMSLAQILPGRTLGVDFTAGRSAVYATFPSTGGLRVVSYGSGVGGQNISLAHLGSNGSLIFQGVYLTSQ